jgi:hypothetical protein
MIGGKEKIGLKPLTEMTADDRYVDEDGGLYGGGKNAPPDEHRRAAEAAIARLQPRNSKGELALDGVIGFVSISTTRPRNSPPSSDSPTAAPISPTWSRLWIALKVVRRWPSVSTPQDSPGEKPSAVWRRYRPNRRRRPLSPAR